MQLLLLLSSLYFPASHALQDDAPGPLYVPASQREHDDAPGFEKFPRCYYPETVSSGWKKLAEGHANLHGCPLHYSYLGDTVAVTTRQLVQ